MEKIPFVKYTLFGNNFVIIDETESRLLTESEKSDAAVQLTHLCFGIGSDGLIVIQPCRPDVIKDINDTRHYWKQLPDLSDSNYILRMFEPNGDESYSCGNGLISIAHYLYTQYGISSARIATEVPGTCPKVISIGSNTQQNEYWANMGTPRRIPSELTCLSSIEPYDGHIDKINGLKIEFRKNGQPFFKNETELTLSGYLVFTGEPHLVVLTENGFSLKALAELMFFPPHPERAPIIETQKMLHFSAGIVQRIGRDLIRNYAEQFPAGINIDFIRIADEPGIVEYRCFERGINQETLACGTGAVAVSAVAQRLHLIETTDQITIWPHRCRWYDPSAQYCVKNHGGDRILYGNPTMICRGVLTTPLINATCLKNRRIEGL
ncbi:MAG: hypothetical protein PHP23_14540 [Desulfobacterales bacterium]|nr:hypothetical protein [Desulfobacterales bacterium]MDD4072170.1 hypothetical protein [Desulfobacterales bacterium]MDD4393777.1 hypothetical protein [Desulfobacterales bacterium]